MPPTLPKCHGKLRSEEILKSKAILGFIAIALVVPTSDALASDLPSGAAIRIIDADTIAVEGFSKNIRLYGHRKMAKPASMDAMSNTIAGRLRRPPSPVFSTAAMSGVNSKGPVEAPLRRISISAS